MKRRERLGRVRRAFAIELADRLALPCPTVTVLEVIQRSAEFLTRKGVESPRLQVELLLAHVLKIPRLKLYLDFERLLAEPELDAVRQLVKRRGGREPLQHILGSVSFCGFEIQVDRNVLIPRPETEVLAEKAWQFLQQRARVGSLGQAAAATGGAGMVEAEAEPREVEHAPDCVLDFGTGSGCLAVALARKVPQVRIKALDVSAAALQLARKNALRNEVSDRIEFFEGDGFAALPQGSVFDLIVSNPPYIPTAEIEQLAPEVRDHDPHLALDGGSDGLKMLRSLAQAGQTFLRSGGRLMAEFGDGQEQAVAQIFSERHWIVEEVVNDLNSRPRIVVARGAES
jgi:release factor glutamine methyltransferase